jgi:hypothetical protein
MGRKGRNSEGALMFTVTMMVCSILHGATCKTAELTFADEGQAATPYGCMIGGMMQVAKWSTEHPNWSVQGWKCGRPRMEAKA